MEGHEIKNLNKNICTMTYPRPQMLTHEGSGSGQSHGTSINGKRKLHFININCGDSYYYSVVCDNKPRSWLKGQIFTTGYSP